MEYKPKPDKYFIITSGPTGSGKTGLINITLQQLGIDETTEYTTFLIDALIENDSIYKQKIREIIIQIEADCMKRKENDCERNKYTKPSSELLEQFKNVYFDVRREHGCKDYVLNNGPNCEKILDNQLRGVAKMENKPFIIVFEITGTYIPKWLLSSEYIPDDYIIIVTYSLVNFKNLLIRNTYRAYKSIVDFKNDSTNTKPAPRLPDIREDVFKKTIISIKNTIIELYKKCMRDYNIELCGNRKIDRLLLFDNNTKYKNIFDSSIETYMTEKELLKRLDSSLGDLTVSDGKIKKTRQSRQSRQTRHKSKSRRYK
jgi:hypothetical protein